MNSMCVKDRLKNISKEKNINFNILLKYYVFDRFIVRLANSNYRDNFIVKGGFLLSQLFGVNKRSTMDIDASLKNEDLTEENVLRIINSIINIDLDDNILFSVNDIETIREEDIYGGYRVTLLFQFEGIKELLRLDIATGDPITPKEIVFTYKTMLEDKKIQIWSYNIETVLAEKLESILSKLSTTSRMKDYYDIYLIYNRSWKDIDKNNFKNACENTFKKREFSTNLDDALSVIRNSDSLKEKWRFYCRKNNYAEDISFEDVIKCIESVIKELDIRED